MRITIGLLFVLGLATLAAHAEKPGMSPEQLQKAATHVVQGKVVAVYERHKTWTSEYGDTKEIRYVAEVQVTKVEKGEGLKSGSLVYVRYWSKAWSPPKGNPDMPPPTGCAGHWNVPKEGEMMRVYIDNLTSERVGEKHDGGYNVLLPNGFERLTAGR